MKMYQFTFSLGCAVSDGIRILKKRETFHFCVAFSGLGSQVYVWKKQG